MCLPVFWRYRGCWGLELAADTVAVDTVGVNTVGVYTNKRQMDK